MICSTSTIDPVKILMRRELAAVLNDLTNRAPCSACTRMNRVVIRLAGCPSSKSARTGTAVKYTASTTSKFFVGEVASARAAKIFVKLLSVLIGSKDLCRPS
ncbi:MAG: hypothetical protein RJP95_04095 [Pirellulales bacterium]